MSPVHTSPASSTRALAERAGSVRRLTAGWQAAGGAPGLRAHTGQYGPLPRPQSGLPELIEAAGLTGRGGAGFPTGMKMRTVAARRAAGRRGPAVVVANGMESEPASQKDQALLARAPHLVLDGIELAADAVGADIAHLCLARSREWQVDAVLAAIGERRHAGLDRIAIEVHELPDRYVSSEETSLVHWLNGGEAKPVTTPPRPFEQGVGRRPTLIDNVETLAHVALIARYGADWFRLAGLPEAPGTMLTTVSGAVAHPGVYEIEGGTRVGDVLQLAGASADLGAVLVGGYFGSWHPAASVATLPFSGSGLKPAGAAPGAGVLVALPSGSCGLAEAARILEYLASQSAQQCGPCMFGLPAIADDMAQLAAGRPQGDPVDRLHRRFAQISGRGACRHPDGAVQMAASAITTFAADVHAHARRRPCLAADRRRQQAASLPAAGTGADGGPH